MQQDFLAAPPSLAEFQSGAKASLFLDFDGTLVEIAPTHDTIEVPEKLPKALEGLSGLQDGRLALVSGRSLADLSSHLGTLHLAQSGSHGADSRLADGTRIGREPRSLSGEALRELEQLVADNPGASLETKMHGAAVHYRACPEAEDRIVATASEIAVRHDLAAKRGKCVIELLADPASKGDAVRAFMAHSPFAGSRPVFIGDDVTDEDGFAAVSELGGIGILVGQARATKACYRLENPQDVYRWLGLEIE